jgi:anti-sigma factor RsiW
MRLRLRRAAAPLTCREVVALLTDYLEDALDPPTRERVAGHLAACGNCATHVQQLQVTLEALGTVPPEELSPETERALVAAFRDWRAER